MRRVETMEAQYKEPIFSHVFRGLGLLEILVGIVALLISVLKASVESRQALSDGAIWSVACILSGVFSLGVAQIINLLGLIAFNGGRACDLLQTQARSAQLTQKPVSSAIPPSNSRGSSRPRFQYQVNGATLGPVSEAELQKLAEQGTIDAETFIRVGRVFGLEKTRRDGVVVDSRLSRER